VAFETFLVWLPTIILNRVDEQSREKLRPCPKGAGKAERQAFFLVIDDGIGL
jgi:hypothetical protein